MSYLAGLWILDTLSGINWILQETTTASSIRHALRVCNYAACASHQTFRDLIHTIPRAYGPTFAMVDDADIQKDTKEEDVEIVVPDGKELKVIISLKQRAALIKAAILAIPHATKQCTRCSAEWFCDMQCTRAAKSPSLTCRSIENDIKTTSNPKTALSMIHEGPGVIMRLIGDFYRHHRVMPPSLASIMHSSYMDHLKKLKTDRDWPTNIISATRRVLSIVLYSLSTIRRIVDHGYGDQVNAVAAVSTPQKMFSGIIRAMANPPLQLLGNGEIRRGPDFVVPREYQLPLADLWYLMSAASVDTEQFDLSQTQPLHKTFWEADSGFMKLWMSKPDVTNMVERASTTVRRWRVKAWLLESWGPEWFDTIPGLKRIIVDFAIPLRTPQEAILSYGW